MLFVTGFTLAALLIAPVDERESESDTITLKGGKTHTGWVVFEDDEVVVVRRGSREQVFEFHDIEGVDSRRRSLDDVLERHAALGVIEASDIEALLELARFCEHARLPGEARLFRLLVLVLDPNQPEANEALGHREKSGAWSFKHDGKWHRTEDLGSIAEDWGDRWNLQTAHYDLETNLPMDRALSIAVDLERYYQAFFDLIGTELGQHEPREVMHVLVHADDASYPEPGDGRLGSFDESDRRVHVNAAHGPASNELFHQLTHQMVFMTTRRTPAAKGVMPRWLDEGLADAFSDGTGGRPGQSTFDITSRAATHFRTHAGADEPLDLDRVLVLERTDFEATTDRALKYAQCYTLLHYLLYADGGAHRDALMAFLESAYAGRSSATDFKRILEVEDEEDFERAWLSYVADVARTL